jgi:hypothetical protein
MGFRSTFTTFDTGICWPQWFIGKYQDAVHFNDGKGVISARVERKCWGSYWRELEEDIQKSIDWNGCRSGWSFVVVFLHECGGITRVQIEKDRIVYTEPTGWAVEDFPMHEYCYGCSDAPESEGA